MSWRLTRRHRWLAHLVFWGGLLILLSAMSDRFFYVPSRERPVPPQDPAYQLTEERIPNGEAALAAWVLEPASGEAKATVVFAHGNAGNLENHAGFADFLPRYGYRVLLFDYQGYGESTPAAPSRASTLSDTHAAIRFAAERWGKPFLMGHSLGASLAVTAAGQHPEAVRGLVAVSPFTSYRGIVRAVLQGNPITWLLAWPLSLLVRSGDAPLDWVDKMAPMPILFAHGDEDEIIPPWMSRELFEKAGEPKEYLSLPGVHHNDGWRDMNAAFVERVAGFLDRISEVSPALGLQHPSAPLEKKVIVYSPHGKEILTDFKNLFEKEHPGTSVEFLYISSQQCLERVRNERQTPLADVWWGAGHTTFMAAAAEGLLEPYSPSWKHHIEEGQHDPQDRWYASFLSPEIIFYNRDLIGAEDAPKDWEDLANSEWSNKILLRFPIPSDTMRAIFFGRISSSLQETGSEERAFSWMRALDANAKEYLSGGEQVFRKMAQRVGALSVWTLSDIMLQKYRYQFPFEVVFPEGGCPVILDGIALVKGCGHPQASRAFYEFVTSASSAIRLAADPYFRIPTRRDIPKQSLPEWMRNLDYKTQDLDWNLYMTKMNDWMRRWDEEIKGQGKEPR